MPEKPSIELDWSTLQMEQGRRLPHWTIAEATYHVVFRLADALPASQMRAWQRERDLLLARIADAGRLPTESEAERLDYLFGEHVEKWLNRGSGSCWLREPRIARLVAEALRYFEGQRYRLHAWCIMPSHVHVIVQPLPCWEPASIAASWMRYTAREANHLLQRDGAFWQREAYDHLIRSLREYRRQTEYVCRNPEEAGLNDWPWRWRDEGIGEAGNAED